MNTRILNFHDQQHGHFYIHCLKFSGKENDPYHKALFYLLGLTAETRHNISHLYDFREKCIKFEGFNQGWQTGTTIRICRLAFNLFNGYVGGEETGDSATDYTPYELFCGELQIYMLEAVQLRQMEAT